MIEPIGALYVAVSVQQHCVLQRARDGVAIRRGKAL